MGRCRGADDVAVVGRALSENVAAAVSRRIDAKSSESMTGLREAWIAAVAGLVLASQAIRSSNWTGLAWAGAIGAVGGVWVGLFMVRSWRGARRVPPPPRQVRSVEPFKDDPPLRARVIAGRSDLDRLRIELETIEAANGTGAGERPSTPM
jgi:hypothetical protein